MGWQLLICRPTDWPGRDRVAVWRQLRDNGALSLGHGTWVLFDDLDGRRRADLVEATIHRRLGHVLRVDVPDGDPRAAEVAALVRAALDRGWVRLMRSIDQATVAVLRDPQAMTSGGTLEDLRRTYVEMLHRDPSGGASSLDAARGLSSLAGALDPLWQTWPAECPAGEWSSRLRPMPRTCPDGPHRVEVHPFPGYGWERAFHDFERRTYLPCPDRSELLHGMFTSWSATDDPSALLEAVVRRVEVFALSTDAPTARPPRVLTRTVAS